jgi:hypothetical protein
MQEIPARAALVTAPNVGEGLTTSVSREELEAAARAKDGPPELILDVTRFSDGEPAETRTVAVAWERADLEELLRQSSGNRVILTFDGQTLREAMEADVEAHGLRERAVILAVAATAAGAFVNTAAGQSLGPDDRAVARSMTQQSLSPDDRSVPRSDPTAQITLGADDRAVSRADPTAQPTSLGADDRAVPRAAPQPVTGEPGLSPDDRALPRTDPLAQPSLSPDDRALPRTDPVGQPSLGPDDRALPRTAPVNQPSLGPDDRPLPRTDPLAEPQPVGATSDDGTLIEAPSPGTIAVIGGIALAITGAAFAAAAATRRRVHPA